MFLRREQGRIVRSYRCLVRRRDKMHHERPLPRGSLVWSRRREGELQLRLSAGQDQVQAMGTEPRDKRFHSRGRVTLSVPISALDAADGPCIPGIARRLPPHAYDSLRPISLARSESQANDFVGNDLFARFFSKRIVDAGGGVTLPPCRFRCDESSRRTFPQTAAEEQAHAGRNRELVHF